MSEQPARLTPEQIARILRALTWWDYTPNEADDISRDALVELLEQRWDPEVPYHVVDEIRTRFGVAQQDIDAPLLWIMDSQTHWGVVIPDRPITMIDFIDGVVSDE